jgi:molybdenum cofactor cytidylyltransferase
VTSAAVVLAAGGGSRFEGPVHKLLAPFRGRPVVTWAVEHALGASLDETIVVTGAAELTEVLPAGVRVVHNERWDEGQATSLQAAVAAAAEVGHDAVVVGLGDQPLVPSEAWRAVAAAAGAAIAVATYDGRRRNPVRLHRDIWPLLPTEGDEGARVVMRLRPDLVREVACRGEPADVDTAEDLTRWA